MPRAPLADLAVVSALAAIITVMVAAPVLRAPSARLFGMEIVGRHHPFTLMLQFDRPLTVGVYSQPVTDVAGALLTRVAGRVAAYNWLVLLSFPLSAAAAFLLARYLRLSRAAALVAALAFAFSPFHLAHAGYHPHVAQTQWIPLYLLALWRCLDAPTPLAATALGAAAVLVTLANFYGGLIAAVITPAAVAAHWFAFERRAAGGRRVAITAGVLLTIAGAGVAYATYAAGAVVADRGAFGFPRADLVRYSAQWWSYLMPPLEHPVLGAAARRVWDAAGVREGLLEQQVSLGWGVVSLALVAIAHWLLTWNHRERRTAALAHVPVLVIVAGVALLCSLSPAGTGGISTGLWPSALLYEVVPMFRAYARFGVVVQLMAVLLAGIGIDYLRRTGTRRAHIAGAALVALAACEYVVNPAQLWRDVLPTAAHRWVVQQTGPLRVLDCTPPDQQSDSVRWLTDERTVLLGSPIDDCGEPDLPAKLAATGFTHLLVRRDSAARLAFLHQPAPEGLRITARFADGQVLAVTSAVPAVYTAGLSGFFAREKDNRRSWRWMGADAAWTIVNTGSAAITTALDLELSAFHHARLLTVRIDGCDLQTIAVGEARSLYRLGPLTLAAGSHELAFRSHDRATIAGAVTQNSDHRALAFAFGTWRWSAWSDRP